MQANQALIVHDGMFMPINFRTREVSTNFLNFLLLCLELHGSTDTSRIFSKNVKGLNLHFSAIKLS